MTVLTAARAARCTTLLHDMRRKAMAGARGEDLIVERRADAAGYPDKRFAFQVGQPHASPAGERVGGGRREHDRVGGDRVTGEGGQTCR